MRRSIPAVPAPEESQEAALEILRSVRRIDIRSRRLVRELFSGSYHAVFKGRGIEFSEVREYVPGDDVRSIDWNVTARMDRPFIKQFHEERERTVVFLVDRSGSSRFGSTARSIALVAAETTAVLAFSAAVNQDKVGALLFSDRLEKWVPPRKGRSHVLRIVRDVLFLEPEGKGTGIGEALERTTRMLRRRSLVFLISDFLQDQQFDHALAIAARKHEIVPVVLIDPLFDPKKKLLPSVGLMDAVDLETGRMRTVDTSDPQFRRQFFERLTRAEARRAEAFSGAGLQPVEIHLDADTIAPLVGYFRRRERWRAAGH